MKRLLICSFVLLFISCSESKNISHTETAQIVAESFFSKDESALKKHTTASGYSSLITGLNMYPTEQVHLSQCDSLTYFCCKQLLGYDKKGYSLTDA